MLRLKLQVRSHGYGILRHMQSGDYISDRWLVEIVRGICEKRGIRLKMFSDDWIMELGNKRHIARVIGYKFELNNSVAAQIASDKVAASQIMQAEGVVPVVDHSLVRTKIDHKYDWSIEYAPLVVKPLTWYERTWCAAI